MSRLACSPASSPSFVHPRPGTFAQSSLNRHTPPPFRSGEWPALHAAAFSTQRSQTHPHSPTFSNVLNFL
eukprot:2079223-Pleurochrysis_carterae.AAC.1